MLPAAAKRAGYPSAASVRTANPIYKPAVKAAIEAEINYMALAEGATNIAFWQSFPTIRFLHTGATGGNSSRAEVKVSFEIQGEGTEALAKHLGLFKAHNDRELTVRSVEELIIDTYKGGNPLITANPDTPMQAVENAVKLEYDRRYPLVIDPVIVDLDESEEIAQVWDSTQDYASPQWRKDL